MTHREQLDAAADKLVNSAEYQGCWRIKIDGKFISTTSNKTAWKKLHHAKLALKHEFHPIEWQVKSGLSDDGLSWSDIEETTNAVYNQFLQDRVEFIEV